MLGDPATPSKHHVRWWILPVALATCLTVRPSPLRAEGQPSQAEAQSPRAEGQPSQTEAQPSQVEGQPSLAEAFFEEGDYFRAITEFRRTIFESKDEAQILRLWMRITTAYMKAGRFTDALRTVQKASQLAHNKADQARVCMLTVHVYNAAGVFPQARKQLETCRADGEMLAVLGADRLRLALAATYFESGEWDKTASQLGRAETERDRGPFAKEAELMRESVSGADQLPHRSPALAGVLSAVIPGLGQVYEGRTWDGVQAFVLVGAFAAVTSALLLSDSYRKGNGLMLPIVTGSIGGVFYISNIYGAINGARMSNLMTTSRYINEEKRKYEAVWNLP